MADPCSLHRQLQREREAMELYKASHGAYASGEKSFIGAVLRGDVAGMAQLLAEGEAAEGAERWATIVLDLITRLDPGEGQSLVHWVALYNENRLLQLLVDQLTPFGEATVRAALCTPNKRGNSPLHQAVLGGSHDAMRTLLSLGVNVESRNRWQETPLHLAAQTGDALAILLLFQYNATVDLVDQWERQAGQIAEEHGESSLIQLFSIGANAANTQGASAARRCFANDSLQKVKLSNCSLKEVLNQSLDLQKTLQAPLTSSTSSSVATPAAASSPTSSTSSSSSSSTAKIPSILSKMMEAPLNEDWLFDLLQRSDVSKTPISEAGHFPLDILSADMWGLRPVHKLAAWERLSALQSLLSHSQFTEHADPRAILLNAKRETPLFFAVENGALACAHFLLQTYPWMAVESTSEGTSPLHLACVLAASGTALDPSSAVALVEQLLAQGADPLAFNSQQQTAVHVALHLHRASSTQYSQEVLDLLRKTTDPQAWETIELDINAAIEREQAEIERRKALAQRRLDQKKFQAIRGVLSSPPNPELPPPPPPPPAP